MNLFLQRVLKIILGGPPVTLKRYMPLLENVIGKKKKKKTFSQHTEVFLVLQTNRKTSISLSHTT